MAVSASTHTQPIHGEMSSNEGSNEAIGQSGPNQSGLHPKNDDEQLPITIDLDVSFSQRLPADPIKDLDGATMVDESKETMADEANAIVKADIEDNGNKNGISID